MDLKKEDSAKYTARMDKLESSAELKVTGTTILCAF